MTRIAVIGLGAMGSATLWQLAARGIEAIGFEQFQPGHDRGSSHGESRIIRTAYFEGASYVPLVQRAFALWDDLQAQTGEDLLIRTGGLMIGTPGSEVVAGTRASVEAHKLAHELLDAEGVDRRFPQHVLDADEIAVFEGPAGVLRPERAVRAMASRAAVLGASVRHGSRVEAVEPGDAGVRVTVDGEVHEFDRVVLSVGAWLPTFMPALPLVVTRQVMAWFAIEDGAAFSPDRFPIFMHETGGHQA